MRLSVIIPAYNEAATIGEVIGRVRGAQRPGLDIEILVVDDASTDGTASRVEKEAAAGGPAASGGALKLIRHATNMGKGAAIRTALACATGDHVIIQDADLEYDPADYGPILEALGRDGVPVVYGSRILGDNPHSYWRYYYGGRLLTLCFNWLYGRRLTDLTTGYKAFRLETLRSIPLSCRGFEFCPEVTAKLARRGVPIVEVPISYRPRSMEEGKKIRWRDGVRAVGTLMSLRWGGDS